MEQIASLEHRGAVWRVEWNLWGTEVAVGVAGSPPEVAVYRPDLVGAFAKQVSLVGEEPGEEGEEGAEETE